MKRIALFLLFATCLLLTAEAMPQSTGDDLSTALTNHGMDSGTAMLAGAAIEGAIANNNALLSRISTDETSITTAQAAIVALQAQAPVPGPAGAQGVQGVAGPQGPQGPAGGGSSLSWATPSGTSLHIQAAYPTDASVTPTVQASSKVPYSVVKLMLPVSGTAFYDYVVTIPQAGNYVLSVDVFSSIVSATPILAHFELPPGTPAGSVSYTPTTTNAVTVTGPTVALQAGQQVIRLVIDSSGNSGAQQTSVSGVGVTQQ